MKLTKEEFITEPSLIEAGSDLLPLFITIPESIFEEDGDHRVIEVLTHTYVRTLEGEFEGEAPTPVTTRTVIGDYRDEIVVSYISDQEVSVIPPKVRRAVQQKVRQLQFEHSRKQREETAQRNQMIKDNQKQNAEARRLEEEAAQTETE